MNETEVPSAEKAAAGDLCRFYEDNAPIRTNRGPEDLDDAELGHRLLFTARLAKGDPGLPRTLEAHRIVWSVPEAVGMRWVAAATAQPTRVATT